MTREWLTKWAQLSSRHLCSVDPGAIWEEEGSNNILSDIGNELIIVACPSRTPPYPPHLTSPGRIWANSPRYKILKTIPDSKKNLGTSVCTAAASSQGAAGNVTWMALCPAVPL